MNSMLSIFKNLLIKDIRNPLGRWRLEKCNKQMNNKIDLSNEDHCGPCGQYALEKIEVKDSKKKDIHVEKSKPYKPFS